MAVSVQNISAPGFTDDFQARTDTRAMSVATALFFMVGFLTCLNDVVSPHLKSIFALSYTQTQYIPFFFFSSYFVFSYPGGILVDRYGYKKTMVVGLLVMACGALGFLPAAQTAQFPIFLTALVVLAAGMTVVQVAVNPYVTIIGPPATAASRLNLAQAFNSVGTFIAPIIGSYLILRSAPETISAARLRSMTDVGRQAYRVAQASTVRVPYIAIALGLVLLAIALGLIKLKTTTGISQHTQDFRPGAFAEALEPPASIWSQKWALLGAVGIFTYVGAEVSIGNLLVSYMGLPHIAALKEASAANLLTFYWGGAMIGRFIGSALLQKLRAGVLLAFNALAACILVLVSMHSTFTSGLVSSMHLPLIGDFVMPHSLPMWTMLAVGLCNSVMFPSIFTLGVQGLGSLTSKGSSLLIAAIVGGALVPLAQGALADRITLQPSFIIPAVCYVYIAFFGIINLTRHAIQNPVVPIEPVA